MIQDTSSIIRETVILDIPKELPKMLKKLPVAWNLSAFNTWDETLTTLFLTSHLT